MSSGVHLHDKVKQIRNHKATEKQDATSKRFSFPSGSSTYQVKWSGGAESARAWQLPALWFTSYSPLCGG